MLTHQERSTEAPEPEKGAERREEKRTRATTAGKTSAAAAAAGSSRPSAPVAASIPRPPPADDPLARILARAVAARAQATESDSNASTEVGGLTELVEELSVAIRARNNGKVRITLKLEAFRLDQIMERFRERKGETLRNTIIIANRQGSSRDKGFVRALAILHGGPDGEYEPWAQMGLALIPLGTRDIDFMRLLEERKLPQRKQLEADYNRAFRGIGKTADDTLHDHIVDDVSGWERQKALALLDHDLTPADHLALVTTAITGAHDETALDILRDVWRQGVGAFDALYDDWQRFVKGPGFTKLPLEQAMADELGGVHLEAAQAIFAEYHAMRTRSGQHEFASMAGREESVERSDVRLQEETIVIGLQSGLFTSKGSLVASAAGDLRKAWAKRIKRDPKAAAEWTGRREQLMLLFANAPGLRGADMVEARIQLLREPTPVDRVYLASMRREYSKALDAATDAWQAGKEHELERDLRHPPAGDPRPALAVDERAVPLNEDGGAAYEALTNQQLTHAERAAVRLDMVLRGSARTTKAGDLDATYKFLKSIKSKEVRTAVIEAYVARFLDAGGAGRGKAVVVEGSAETTPDRAIDRFCTALQSPASGFEQSPTMIDLLHLLAPEGGLSAALEFAQRRDKATHTGLLDVYATGLVSAYDAATGEDTQEVADDALSRLRRWVQRTDAEPSELKAIMEYEGVTEVTALAQLGFERFSARLDEVRSVKASVSEAVGMFVDFAGRSLLVAVLGPAGLPGLLAALGSYTAGMLVREGLLGAEYQLESVQNLSTLLAEVATFGFDELMIENVIKELVPKGAAAGRIFGATGMSEVQAKVAQEYLKGSGAKLFEKAAQNMVEGSSFPTEGQLLARAGHAFAAAGLKGVSAKILTSPTVFTPTAERFRENLKKIILNGPPPKAAIGYVMAKELTDMYASPDWGNTTLAEKIARVTKAGTISIVSAMPVAAAFTNLGDREAARAKKLAKSHPDVFYAHLRNDPTLSLAYNLYVADVKETRPGASPKSFADWVGGQREHDLVKPSASAIKDVDDAMTPHATKRWNR